MSENGPDSLLQKVVRIHSITSRPELNGQIGTVTSYLPGRARYLVTLSYPDPAVVAAAARAGQREVPAIALRRENFTPATVMDRAKGKIGELKSVARFLMKDSTVRDEIRRTYISIDQRLPPQCKPEYVVVVLLVLLILSIRMVGFNKTFVVLSLLSILPIMSLADIMAGEDLRTVVRKFPYRLREALVRSTGFTRITTRMAMGAFVIVLLLSVNVLLAPRTRRHPTSRLATSTGGGLTLETGELAKVGRRYTNEEIYKLGYDDGSASNDYGLSLPDDDDAHFPPRRTPRPDSHTMERGNDDLDYITYNPSPPQPKKNKFGFGTIVSLLALGRVIHSLGFTPNGNFDVQYFMMNLKNMETWKMGLAVLMLYRVVNAFM